MQIPTIAVQIDIKRLPHEDFDASLPNDAFLDLADALGVEKGGESLLASSCGELVKSIGKGFARLFGKVAHRLLGQPVPCFIQVNDTRVTALRGNRIGGGKEFVRQLAHGKRGCFVAVPTVQVHDHLQAVLQDIVSTRTALCCCDHAMWEQGQKALVFAFSIENKLR